MDRAPIDEGHKKVVVIENNIVTSDGLACDWIYGHLFWSDTGTNSIMMSDFDGKMIATVITDRTFYPLWFSPSSYCFLLFLSAARSG